MPDAAAPFHAMRAKQTATRGFTKTSKSAARQADGHRSASASKRPSGAKHQATTQSVSEKNAPPAPRVLTSLALLIGRWGQWPAWTPLLLRTLAANPTVAFYTLSDVPPAPTLPANIRHISLTLPQLLARLRRTIGVRLKSLSASGTYGSGVSSAKTNDFKPMFGAAFADLLSGYAWWGYLQEDLLVGDLRAFATEALLARSDVVCPYLFPLNASGVLMLYRNTPRGASAGLDPPTSGPSHIPAVYPPCHCRCSLTDALDGSTPRSPQICSSCTRPRPPTSSPSA